MATITITPGESFDPTEALTSTKLNDLGSPTAALTPGSIGTTDIADDAITLDQVNANAVGTSQLINDSVNSDKILDASVIENKLATDAVTTGKIEDLAVTTAKIGNGQVTPTKMSTGAPTWGTDGSILTKGDRIEINYGLVGDDDAYIDFHSTSASEPNFDARIHKVTGENSNFQLENKGTGSTVIYQDGEAKFRTQGGEEGYTTIAGGGTGAADGAKITLNGSTKATNANNIDYIADKHIFKNAAGGASPSYVQMNMTNDGNAELVVESSDATGDANITVSSFTPSIILQDKSTTQKDFQILADGGNLRIKSGDTSGDAQLTNEIVRIKSTDEVEIKGNLLINNVVDKPAILIEDTSSGAEDREGEIAVPTGEAFSLGFWDAAAAVGSRFISKLRFDSSLIYLRSRLKIGGTTDDATTEPKVYLDGIRSNTIDELRLSANKLTFYTDTNYATKVIDATDTKVSIDIPLEVSDISGPESADVLTLRADPESPDPTNGGAQISLHSSDSAVPNQIYTKSAFIFFQNMAGSTVASIGSTGPEVAKDLTTKEYVDDFSTKAFCVFNGTTGALYSGSKNVSGVVRNSAGNWTVTLTNAAPSSAFCVSASATAFSGTSSNYATGAHSSTSTTITVERERSNGDGADASKVSVMAIW